MNERLKILNNGRLFTRAAIYIPVIASDQYQKANVRIQLEQCNKFIQRNNWILTDIYLEKEGNGILRLMRERASRSFDVVVSATRFCNESPAGHSRNLSITAVCDARLWRNES
jgi:hypothetical protein